MRVFLDTNVLVAAIATRGLCADVFEIIIQSHQLLTSPEVLDEVDRVMRNKLGTPKGIAAAFIELISDQSEIVVPGDAVPSIRDPDDAPIVAAALNGRADVFVTGDKELLEIDGPEGLRIASPRDFYGLLSGETS